MKKILALILAFSVCAMVPVSVSAETLIYETSIFIHEYTVDSEGGATIERVQLTEFGYGREIDIPETVDDHTVVAIGDNAYAQISPGYTIYLPATVTSIGDNAFGDCEISYVYYGGTESEWATLMENTGEQNDRLRALTPTDMSFTENGFEYFVTESGTAHIEMYHGPSDVMEVNFPATLGGRPVTAVGTFPMRSGTLTNHWGSLERITFPDSIIDLYDVGVYYQPIKELVLPPNLRSIPADFCTNCTQLETITIPDSLEELPFIVWDCEALKDVYFEGTKTEWEAYEIAGYIREYPEVTVHFGEESGQCGDYDDNGDIDMNDALKLFQGVAGRNGLDAVFSAMDVNDDGVVNMLDALVLYGMVS